MKTVTQNRAYCTSYKCTGKPENSLRKKDYVRKEVSKHCMSCPECGSALIWTQPNKNARVKDVTSNRAKDLFNFRK